MIDLRKPCTVLCAVLLLSAVFAPPAFSSKKRKAQQVEPAEESAEETAGEAPVEFPPFTVGEVLNPPVEKGEEEEEPAGDLRGTVIDEKGEPVQGVLITCLDESGIIIARDVTDENGAYDFSALPTGNYTINVDYSGFSSPVEVSFGEEMGRPPIPTGLQVSEVMVSDSGQSIIRVAWDRMKNVTGYKCALYLRGQSTPIQEYPDMKQNHVEFGKLKEDTEYQIRVYSKNPNGYSSSYRVGIIRTKNRPPLPPYGIGVLSAINNAVEIVWRAPDCEDLAGYLIQIKKENGRYLYYAKDKLTGAGTEAFVVRPSGDEYESIYIEGMLEDGTPVLENTMEYSFKFYSIDRSGMLSTSSPEIQHIVLEDTIPPRPPGDVFYEFVDENMLRINWKRADRDTDRYALYYGVTRDRWDEVVYTKKNTHELLVDREKLASSSLYLSVVAIDRAGNESGYMPVKKATTVAAGRTVTEDIVFSSSGLYRDYSEAIREPPVKKAPPKKKVVKPAPPPKPTRYGIDYLREKGYVVEDGETAILSGDLLFPVDALIMVKSGGKLEIRDAKLTASDGLWGGIRFTGGSRGTIQDSSVRSAAIGIGIIGCRDSVQMRNVKVSDCVEKGVYIKDSSVSLSILTVYDNPTGMFAENSSVIVDNSSFYKNTRGLTVVNYSLKVSDSLFRDNGSYGLRLYGGGTVERCIFSHNLVGAVLDQGKGSPRLIGNTVKYNTMDGIVVSTENGMLKNNIIAFNGRHGIYNKDDANPVILQSDILNNVKYGITGGGVVRNCHIAYNNGSVYIDDTGLKGKQDNVLSSSSAGVIKQILNADLIEGLSYVPIVQ